MVDGAVPHAGFPPEVQNRSICVSGAPFDLSRPITTVVGVVRGLEGRASCTNGTFREFADISRLAEQGDPYRGPDSVNLCWWCPIRPFPPDYNSFTRRVWLGGAHELY